MNYELPNDFPQWLKKLIEQNEAIAKIHVFNGHSVTEVRSTCKASKCDGDIMELLECIEKGNKCMYKELT